MINQTVDYYLNEPRHIHALHNAIRITCRASVATGITCKTSVALGKLAEHMLRLELRAGHVQLVIVIIESCKNSC